MDWDDARIFLAAARAGSLRAAARDIGLSQPTVGRKLARFEASISGQPLFERLPEGLRLTKEGAALLPLAERLEMAALTLERRLAVPSEIRGGVRISCGEWSAGFLSARLAAPGGSDGLPATITPEFVQSDQTANLTKRAADLGVRHGRPDAGDLYVTRLGVISCAVYRSTARAPPDGAWITYTEEQAHYASTAWTVSQLIGEAGGYVALRASTLAMQLTAVRSGAGQALIPCYLGDRDPLLVRSSAVVRELDAIHWLIVHRDLRRVPRVRVVMRHIERIFEADRKLLEGS